MHRRNQAGFTIIELLVVVAVIAIIASVAIPRMLGARLTANESNAIAVLRAITASQMQAQTANSIDTDGDGLAEYAYFGELGGVVPARKSVGGAPAAGLPGVDELAPSPLIAALGAVKNSSVQRGGYLFQIWLPDATGVGIAEDPNGGKAGAPFPDPNAGEQIWCCYAWPLVAATTGNKCFFINQEGSIYQTANRGAGAYSDITTPPPFDAAFSVPLDMTSPLPTPGAVANDGHSWVPVQ